MIHDFWFDTLPGILFYYYWNIFSLEPVANLVAYDMFQGVITLAIVVLWALTSIARTAD